jgi:hypothetical protein
MKYHPIHERELRHIAAVNTVVAACFSVATLFTGILIGCVWDSIQEGTPLSATSRAFIAGCALFAIAAAGLGGFFIWHKKSELSEILAETGDRESD